MPTDGRWDLTWRLKGSLPIAEHVYYKQKKLLHILVSSQYQVGNLNFVKHVEQIHKSDTVPLNRHISLLPLHFCSKTLDLQSSLDQTQNIISRNKTNIYPCDNQSRKLLISSWKTDFFFFERITQRETSVYGMANWTKKL